MGKLSLTGFSIRGGRPYACDVLMWFHPRIGVLEPGDNGAWVGPILLDVLPCPHVNGHRMWKGWWHCMTKVCCDFDRHGWSERARSREVGGE